MAACNPHRGNSLASNPKLWTRGTYYVKPLHPTLQFLKWDYGSLNESEEKDYIREKMKMVDPNIKDHQVVCFTMSKVKL